MKWELESLAWLDHVTGDCGNVPPYGHPCPCSEPSPALRYLDVQCPESRQFPAWEYCADARPGIDEVFRRDAMASKRHDFVPFYESTSGPICKVRFSKWISERPFNSVKDRLEDDLAECDADSGYADIEDEWYECESEQEKERDGNTEEEAENVEQGTEAIKVISLGDRDGESNDGFESHQPGSRQLMGPAGTEKVVLRAERERGSACVDAP